MYMLYTHTLDDLGSYLPMLAPNLMLQMRAEESAHRSRSSDRTTNGE